MASTEIASAIARQAPKLGRKPIYLPKFTITLLRTPDHPPTFASFIVPPELNKLDMRDYLYNVYGVTVRGVRSYIQQQKVMQDKPGKLIPSPRRWYRPRAVKRMMVEMDQPFVWPEEPTDLEPWDKETFEAVREEREVMQAPMRPDFKKQPARDRKSIAEQAQALLEGRTRWRSTPQGSQWQSLGDEIEVEKDVDINAVNKQ